MGTSIELMVGKVSLSYFKNHMGIDFGYLFQNGDETRRELDSIDYDYYKEHPEIGDELAEHETVFARKLGRILCRLELLGHTLDAARNEYEAVVKEAIETSSYIDEAEEAPSFLNFDEFCTLACRYPLGDLKSEYIEYDNPERETLSQGRFVQELEDFSRVPSTENSDSYWSESSFISAKLCILSAESMLRIFAINPANLDVEVVWELGPLISAGWAKREDFRPGARKTQKILIATEGKSDARIINRALHIFRHDVTDFFYFVDVEEAHHFWGTGNLVKFGESLLRIDIQNKVLFLLDNDAEGVEAYRKLQKLKAPNNMHSMLLPNLDELTSFPTRGPEGVTIGDINGRAAAVECYLDLNIPNYPPAQVTWSNYKKEIDTWHGALDHKEIYQKHFISQTEEAIRSGSYDASKLLKLLDALIKEAIKLITDTSSI